MESMKYLMYVRGGVIRKFCLSQAEVIIGRNADCDIVFDDPAFSKKHCRVVVGSEHITIQDLGSHNGTFVGQHRIQEAQIRLDDSFSVEGTEFYFKDGHVREFAISRELSGIMARLTGLKRHKAKTEPDTHDSDSKYAILLPLLVDKAIQHNDIQSFCQELRLLLQPVLPVCGLYLRHQGRYLPIVTERGLDVGTADLSAAVAAGDPTRTIVVQGQSRCYRSFVVPETDSGLLLFSPDPRTLDNVPMIAFIEKLAEIISLNQRNTMAISFDPDPVPVVCRHPDVTIVGRSAALKRLVDIAAKIAPKQASVIITGESGTGKELFARLIHQLSGRKNYVAINCAAIPATLLESELFGYEAGAFTDARRLKLGKLEEASGGTLVLDEIGDMPLEIQVKLLRVIQERSLTRLGGSQTIPIDLRIIAITNQDLYGLVEAGRFRQDLFFRLRVHELSVPPLRERSEDIPALVMHFAKLFARENQVSPAGFSESVNDCFCRYNWPGNVRELENEIRMIMEIAEDRELISDQHLTPRIVAFSRSPRVREGGERDLSFRQNVDQFEKNELLRLLQENRGNKSKTARDIGMSYQGFLLKLKKYGIV